MSEDLIRRSDAIEAIEVIDWYHQNKSKDMVSGANSSEHQAWYKADDIYKALEAIPTADKPTVIRIKTIMRKEDYDDLEKRIKQQNSNVIVIPHNAELVTPVDRPQGEWIGEADGYYNGELIYDTWYCSNCDYVVDDEEPPTWNFCPNCGADMRAEQTEPQTEEDVLREQVRAFMGIVEQMERSE